MSAGSAGSSLVLDSFAMLAYFFGEPNGTTVREYLRRGVRKEVSLHLSVVNFGEIFYMAWRKHGIEVTQLNEIG
jgi:hypothetical protein